MPKAHSKFAMGKPVVVRMRDGTAFKAKFKARKSQRYIFFDHPDVRPKDVETIYIWKVQPEGRQEVA
jgi:hypothetical protein